MRKTTKKLIQSIKSLEDLLPKDADSVKLAYAAIRIAKEYDRTVWFKYNGRKVEVNKDSDPKILVAKAFGDDPNKPWDSSGFYFRYDAIVNKNSVWIPRYTRK